MHASLHYAVATYRSEDGGGSVKKENKVAARSKLELTSITRQTTTALATQVISDTGCAQCISILHR